MPSVQTNNNNQAEQLQHTSKDIKTGSNNQLNTVAGGGGGGNKTPSEQPEYIKQVQIMIEKKIRNLEKRKQKLEEYQEMQKKGTVLNQDQLSAVSKYEEVKATLELIRDLDKQLVTLGNDTLKQLKKQAKKEQNEREEQLREKLREAEKFKSLLNTFSQENVRNDFLEGRNGAVQLTKDELTLFDEFSKLVNPLRLFKPAENEINESVDHLLNLIDNKNKSVSTTTYSELRKLFDRVIASAYWTYEPVKPQSQPQQQQQTQEYHQPQTESVQESEQKQNVTYQHNTSTEDYVIVTSQEVENTPQHLQQQQQQQHQGTFFTTLNNENLTNATNEEINFLQDSEISQQQQYDEQQEQHHQQQDQQQQFSHQGQQGQNNYGKRHYNNNNDGGNYQPRNNNGNYNRRPFNPSDNRGGRGGFRGGPQGGRGGYQGNNRGGSGGFRGGKPRGAQSGGYRQQQPEVRSDN